MEGSNKKGSRRGYGSSMFPFGSPINSSRRSVLSPGALQSPAPPTSSSGGEAGASPHVLRGRLRAQDVYGGPVAFGGTPSGSRGQARKSMLDGNNITGDLSICFLSVLGKELYALKKARKTLPKQYHFWKVSKVKCFEICEHNFFL